MEFLFGSVNKNNIIFLYFDISNILIMLFIDVYIYLLY